MWLVAPPPLSLSATDLLGPLSDHELLRGTRAPDGLLLAPGEWPPRWDGAPELGASQFGASLARSRASVLVSAPHSFTARGPNTGAATLLHLSALIENMATAPGGAVRLPFARLLWGPNSEMRDGFGASVAIADDGTLVVGSTAHRPSSGENATGAVYVFDALTPPPLRPPPPTSPPRPPASPAPTAPPPQPSPPTSDGFVLAAGIAVGAAIAVLGVVLAAAAIGAAIRRRGRRGGPPIKPSQPVVLASHQLPAAIPGTWTHGRVAVEEDLCTACAGVSGDHVQAHLSQGCAVGIPAAFSEGSYASPNDHAAVAGSTLEGSETDAHDAVGRRTTVASDAAIPSAERCCRPASAPSAKIMAREAALAALDAWTGPVANRQSVAQAAPAPGDEHTECTVAPVADQSANIGSCLRHSGVRPPSANLANSTRASPSPSRVQAMMRPRSAGSCDSPPSSAQEHAAASWPHAPSKLEAHLCADAEAAWERWLARRKRSTTVAEDSAG